MKKYILSLFIALLTVCSSFSQSNIQFGEYIPVTPRPSVSYDVQRAVPNGQYQAVVEYRNSSTGYSATYRLVVEVERGCVEVIYFSNGGYLHRSSTEYWYRDGGLRLARDRDGDLYAYTTVNVSNRSLGQRSYTIYIQ